MAVSVWEREVELGRSFENPLCSFAATISRLPIRKEDIKGHVLIGGHGPAFPERALVCSPDSNYKQIRNGVTSITCCDPEPFTNPHLRVSHPVEVCGHTEEPKRGQGSFNYYPSSLQEALKGMCSGIFDTAMFFRIVNLQEQFPSLLPLVAKVLRPNGIFTGSGDFDSEDKLRNLLEVEFDIRSLALLPSPDYSGFRYRTHIGFILQGNSKSLVVTDQR